MFISQKEIKKRYRHEISKEQYFDGKSVWVITYYEGKWSLYNYTQNIKIGTSKDLTKLLDKIPD